MGAGEKKEVVVEKEKREEIIEAVYKLHLHCPECARTVERTIKLISGVHKVHVNVETGIVKVKGVFDVKKIHARLEKKTRKKVELISPKPKLEKIVEKKEEKKEEVVKTTVVKVHLHCDRCAYDLKYKLHKLKSVHRVTMDREKQTCTVVGTIEDKKLVEYIRKKARKYAEIIPGKVEKKVEEKVEEKKKVIVVKDGKEEVKEEVVEKKEELKTKEIVVPYFIHCTHAPDCFSDENPNACSVM